MQYCILFWFVQAVQNRSMLLVVMFWEVLLTLITKELKIKIKTITSVVFDAHYELYIGFICGYFNRFVRIDGHVIVRGVF